MANNLPEKCEDVAPSSMRRSVYRLPGETCAIEKAPQLHHFRRIAVNLLLAGFFLFSSAFTQTPPNQPQERRRSETIAQGIEHLEIKRGDLTGEEGRDRWVIHALLLDPRQIRLVLARALDEVIGTETTSSLAARHGAVAAINGGYFRTTGTYRGEPMGTLMIGGKVLSEPFRGRAALAVSNAGERTRIAITRTDFKAEVIVNRREMHPISGFNRPRGENELIVFTPEFHRTTLTPQDGIEAIVERSRVTSVHDGAGSSVIPTEGYVLSASGTARQWVLQRLRPGVRVEVRAELIADPPLPFTADFIIGGGPQLVASGKASSASESEHFSEEFSRKRHPRTALGVRRDGHLVLVTVDGRQPKISVGMTIDELTALMLELGCVEALNLDGGGSTTMVIKGKVVNSPSDQTGERPVSDALLVFPRKGERGLDRKFDGGRMSGFSRRIFSSNMRALKGSSECR